MSQYTMDDQLLDHYFSIIVPRKLLKSQKELKEEGWVTHHYTNRYERRGVLLWYGNARPYQLLERRCAYRHRPLKRIQPKRIQPAFSRVPL